MALYLEHFGLSEPPFRITPHTDFFFDGADRGATLEALIYAVLHDEGIVKVSGEVGSGKTMLCRVLMERLPKEVETIYLATPSLAKDEIIHAIGDDLKLAFSQERRSVALRELQDHLIRLYGEGRRVVVLIDEAMSGLNPAEIEQSMRLIRRVRDDTGVAIVWVEHVVKAIMQVVERIVVLNFGEVIASGAPAEIARNGAVIEAYLGTAA